MAAEIRRAMEDEAERKGIIEAEARTGEEMEEESLEDETKWIEEAKARHGVVLEMSEKDAERR